MKPNDNGNGMPEDAADAWADVYIDVAEKLDAEEATEDAGSAKEKPADAPQPDRKDDDADPS